MRRLVAATIAATTLTLAVTLGAPAFAADADASVHQIYEAAESGHLDQAQTMMDQVLKDHPQSARAHYVQAELYAKEGKLSLARSELGEAEQLKPGLPGENPQSVQRLKAQLGMASGRAENAPRVIGANMAPGAAPRFPWGTVLIAVLVIGGLWMLFRRRSYPQYPAGAVGGGPGGYAGPGGGYGPGYGPGGGMAGGGIGSGIGSGLASGLAVGAGVVAGEELAHHFMDGGRPAGAAPPVADNNEWNANTNNSDMGGSDFGVNDAGSGWDDSSGGGGGGGDDWT